MRDDVAVRTEDLDRLHAEIRKASRGPAAEYADVLERAIATCKGDPAAADYLDVVDLHSELAEAYDQLGRVEEALREADLLVELGYDSQPDGANLLADLL